MKVFTPNEINDKSIPRPGHFLEAFEDVSKGFKEIYRIQQENHFPLCVVAAIVIGSMARKHDMFCTSDIDIIVFLDDSSVNDEKMIVRYAKEYSEYYTVALSHAVMSNVPVNIYNVFTSRIEHKASRHNTQFLKHAIASMDGFGGIFPSGMIVGDKKRVREIFKKAPNLTRADAFRYIVTKQENLTDGFLSLDGLSQEAAARLYGNCFNAPFHAARQVLDVKKIQYEDSKSGVIEAITDVSSRVKDELTTLSEMAWKYAKSCDLYRDDMTGLIRRPKIDPQVLYETASSTLSALRDILVKNKD